jgi:hypothetical protein
VSSGVSSSESSIESSVSTKGSSSNGEKKSGVKRGRPKKGALVEDEDKENAALGEKEGDGDDVGLALKGMLGRAHGGQAAVAEKKNVEDPEDFKALLSSLFAPKRNPERNTVARKKRRAS